MLLQNIKLNTLKVAKPRADPGLTVGGCLGHVGVHCAHAREILCATPTFGIISAHVRMHVPLNFFICTIVAS